MRLLALGLFTLACGGASPHGTCAPSPPSEAVAIDLLTREAGELEALVAGMEHPDPRWPESLERWAQALFELARTERAQAERFDERARALPLLAPVGDGGEPTDSGDAAPVPERDVHALSAASGTALLKADRHLRAAIDARAQIAMLARSQSDDETLDGGAYRYAALLWRCGLAVAATSELTALLQRRPNGEYASRAYLMLGDALLLRHDRENAEQLYARAALGDTAALAQTRIASLRVAAQDEEGAVRALSSARAAEQADPSDAGSQALLQTAARIVAMEQSLTPSTAQAALARLLAPSMMDRAVPALASLLDRQRRHAEASALRCPPGGAACAR